MVVDVLSRMLIRAMKRDRVRGIMVGLDRIEVSYLQFADDTILFRQDDDRSLGNVLTLLQVFEHISRLKINFTKSSLVGVNIEGEVLERVVCSIRYNKLE